MTDYFASSSNSKLTFNTHTTAFHLTSRSIAHSIENAARLYHIEYDFYDALAEFFNDRSSSRPFPRGNRRAAGILLPTRPDYRNLDFHNIRIWPYVRVQTKSVQLHRFTNPSVPLQAQQPGHDGVWIYGRRDACIVTNRDPTEEASGFVDLNNGQ